MRLCFFVNVRKASGRRAGVGRRMGRMVGMAGLNAGCAMGLFVGLKGWTGVPKAGEEDGIGLSVSLAAVAMTDHELYAVTERQCKTSIFLRVHESGLR